MTKSTEDITPQADQQGNAETASRVGQQGEQAKVLQEQAKESDQSKVLREQQAKESKEQ